MPQETAQIRKVEDKTGTQFFPITHVEAVIDDNGDTASILLGRKQNTLVSGVNIKTVNNLSLVGSGNIEIEGANTVKYIPQELTVAQQMQARANLGLYGKCNYISYGNGVSVTVNPSTGDAVRFGAARVGTDGSYSEIPTSGGYDELAAALPSYEDIASEGGIYFGDEWIEEFYKESEFTTSFSAVIDDSFWSIYICRGYNDVVDSGFSFGSYTFPVPGIYCFTAEPPQTGLALEIPWEKATIIPEEYLPKQKTPGILYLDVKNAIEELSSYESGGYIYANGVFPDTVCSAFNITQDELESIFETEPTEPKLFNSIAIKSDDGQTTYYYDKYQLLVSRDYGDGTPLIYDRNWGRVLDFHYSEVPQDLPVTITKLSNGSTYRVEIGYAPL